MTTPDPFGTPGPPPVLDRTDVDPFGTPGSIGRTTRQGDAEDRAPIPRDQYDRYLMPHLDGTKPAANKGFTRVSTTKSALSNTIGIQRWAARRIALGLGKDANAVEAAMRAAAMPDSPEKEKALGRIADGAYDTGGGKERAGLGIELHELTEDINRGIPLTVDSASGDLVAVGERPIPAERQPDLRAYFQMLTDNHITLLPEYLERQVMCPYNQAGTFDNIVRYWNPVTEEWELVVADLKTGRSLDLGWLEILIQLWSYANAYAMWTTTAIERNDPKDPTKITGVQGFYEPMPRELRTDKALIFHVPLDGTATLYVLDLSGVERYVRAAVEAKRANAEAKLKVTKLSTYRPDAFVAPPTVPKPVEMRQGVVVVPADQGPTGDTKTWPGQLWPIPSDTPAVTWNAEDGTRVDGQHVPPGFTPTPTAPTPDAAAQVAKAAERTKVAAKVLANAAPGQLPGDSTEPPAPTHDPVTGRKKRTCGYCHLPGHTQKNCPTNPASAKYNPQVVRALSVVPDPLPEDAVIRVDAMAKAAGRNDDSDDLIHTPSDQVHTVTDPLGNLGQGPWLDQDKAPYCLRLHPEACQWTSQPPAPPGVWGCSITGKPSEAAWRNGTTAVTKEPPFYGAPNTADTADGDDAPPPWPAPMIQPDMIAWGIANATTVDELLAHRQACISAGTWTQNYDAKGAARYQALI